MSTEVEPADMTAEERLALALSDEISGRSAENGNRAALLRTVTILRARVRILEAQVAANDPAADAAVDAMREAAAEAERGPVPAPPPEGGFGSAPSFTCPKCGDEDWQTDVGAEGCCEPTPAEPTPEEDTT